MFTYLPGILYNSILWHILHQQRNVCPCLVLWSMLFSWGQVCLHLEQNVKSIFEASNPRCCRNYAKFRKFFQNKDGVTFLGRLWKWVLYLKCCCFSTMQYLLPQYSISKFWSFPFCWILNFCWGMYWLWNVYHECSALSFFSQLNIFTFFLSVLAFSQVSINFE